MNDSAKITLINDFNDLELWDVATFNLDEDTAVTAPVRSRGGRGTLERVTVNVNGQSIAFGPKEFVRAERRALSVLPGDGVRRKNEHGLPEGPVGIVEARPEFQSEDSYAVLVLWEGEDVGAFHRPGLLVKVFEQVSVPNAMELRPGDVVVEPARVGFSAIVRRRV